MFWGLPKYLDRSLELAILLQRVFCEFSTIRPFFKEYEASASVSDIFRCGFGGGGGLNGFCIVEQQASDDIIVVVVVLNANNNKQQTCFYFLMSLKIFS